MMKTAFIIAEYNPFHNGHRHHLEQTRRLTGADCVAAVMSGNYVQRGEAAVGEKLLRAETAVRGGADLVLELPVKYAVSNAGRFAAGAVAVALACGAEGYLSFGASATLAELKALAAFLCDPALEAEARNLCRDRGKTYPAAVDALLRQKGMAGEADLLKDANNVLAVEYLKRLPEDGPLRPFAVERPLRRGHDAPAPDGDMASASFLRGLLYEENALAGGLPARLADYMPQQTFCLLEEALREGRFPLDRRLFSVAAFSRLLTVSAAEFAALDNVNQGLENKLAQAVRDSACMEEVAAAVKSKRFTLARLRQILLAATLCVTKEDASSAPSYLRVLAFNDRGREALARMRETATLPVVTNLSDAVKQPSCARDAALEYQADKLFDACLPRPRGGNRPFQAHPVYVSN